MRLLDDQQFALDVIRNVRERKPCSKYAVVIKLKNMRIEDSVIQSAVEDWTYETDQEMASKVLLKDLGPSNSNPNLEDLLSIKLNSSIINPDISNEFSL